MYKNFENSVAIITGAASGLGLAIAKKLSQFNVRLALFDSNEDLLSRIKSEIQSELTLYTVDVTSEDQVKKAVDDAANQFGSICPFVTFLSTDCAVDGFNFLSSQPLIAALRWAPNNVIIEIR